MTTIDKILSLLRRETLTVSELMTRLQVTRNAIMVPLRQLEARGLVVGQARKEARVGKPSVEYGAAPGREDEDSLAYPAFTALLVETLSENLDQSQVEQILQLVGQKMAQNLEIRSSADFASRVKHATKFADDLGAATATEALDSEVVIRSHSCPLGRAVRKDPRICQVMSSFFKSAIGESVDVCCERGEKLVCQFRVKPEDTSPVTV